MAIGKRRPGPSDWVGFAGCAFRWQPAAVGPQAATADADRRVLSLSLSLSRLRARCVSVRPDELRVHTFPGRRGIELEGAGQPHPGPAQCALPTRPSSARDRGGTTAEVISGAP
jgi:hypothetical protein